MKRESEFQKSLIKEIKEIFSGCYIFKLDPSRYQGIPDLLILYKNKWATLECKKSNSAAKRPNQDYHVEAMNKMSFSSFISPETKEEVLNGLCKAFRVKR